LVTAIFCLLKIELHIFKEMLPIHHMMDDLSW